MKKITKHFLLMAASALTLASCQIELVDPNETIEPIQDDNIVLLTLNTDAPQTDSETKTLISGTTPSWANGDKVTVVYTNTSATIATASSSALNSDGSSASFSVALTSPDATVDAYAYYPSNAKSATSTSATLVLNNDQYPTGTSFDGTADIMVSKSFTPSGSVSTQFKRLGAILRIKVSNASINSEKLISVTITGDNPLAGDVAVDLTDGSITGVSNGNNTVSATFDGEKQFTVSESGQYVYLVVLPQTLAKGSHLVINGVTSNHTFTKDITLGQDIVLSSGHIQPLNITIASVTDSGVLNIDWSWDGGVSSDLSAISGVTLDVDSDYAADKAPYRVKLAKSDQSLQFHTNSSIASVSLGVKMIGGDNTSKLEVWESADGTDWGVSKIEELTISGKQNDIVNLTTTASFNASSRYVKFVFVKGSNVGVGPIVIRKKDTRAAAGIAWKKSGVAASSDAASLEKVTNVMPTIELENPNGLPVSFTSSNPGVVTITSSTSLTSIEEGAVLTLVGDGKTVITASFAGNNAYAPSSVRYELTVSDNRVTKETLTDGSFSGSTSARSWTSSSGITITQSKNGGNDVSSSYTTIKTLRVYRQNTLSFTGKTFRKIIITYKTSYPGNDGLVVAADGGAASAPDKDETAKTLTWEDASGASSVVFTNGISTSTTTQLRPESITFYYD